MKTYTGRESNHLLSSSLPFHCTGYDIPPPHILDIPEENIKQKSRDAQNSPNIWQPPQNSTCQKRNMKQVLHLVPTNIRGHRTKFKSHGALAPWRPGCVHLCRRRSRIRFFVVFFGTFQQTKIIGPSLKFVTASVRILFYLPYTLTILFNAT